MLGRAARLLGDHPQSLAAWLQATKLAPTDSDAWVHYAEAILANSDSGQKLPPEFAAATQRIRELDPQSLEGMFFGGLAEQDAGNIAAARSLWEQLLQELPEDSPQRTEIQQRLDALGGGG